VLAAVPGACVATIVGFALGTDAQPDVGSVQDRAGNS
jgi:hypothetical protein